MKAQKPVDACIRFAKAVADYVLAMQMEMFGLRLDILVRSFACTI